MKWCILLLLLMVYNSGSYPTTESSENPSNDESDSSKKLIGSSVVTSVSVILNGNEPQFTDAVGNTIPKPLVPLQVASPINLLNPDRYEFYTFNDNGDLVKRLMTLEEIQSIVANGNGDGAVIHTFPISDRDPEKNVHDIVESVQKVLNKEVAWKKNMTNEHLVLDTPDVSSSWSMILPAIFGNTGTEIFPNKPQRIAATTESEVKVSSTTKAPLIHKAKPHPQSTDKDRPDADIESQGTHSMNKMTATPSYNMAGLPSRGTSPKPNVVKSTNKPQATKQRPTSLSSKRPATKPIKTKPTTPATTTTTTSTTTTTTTPMPTTTSTPTTTLAPTTTTTQKATTSSPTSTSTAASSTHAIESTPAPTTTKPDSSTSYHTSSRLPPTTQTAPTKTTQAQIPVGAVDITYGSDTEFSEYHQSEFKPDPEVDEFGGIEADEIASEATSGYLTPVSNQQEQDKEDINTLNSIDQILESLTNNLNTERVELQSNTKHHFTTVEPVQYKGELSQDNKNQDMPMPSTESDTFTTFIPDLNNESNKPKEPSDNKLHFEPLYADVHEPVLTELSTDSMPTEFSTLSPLEATTNLNENQDIREDNFSSKVPPQSIKVEDKPLSIIETIDQLISDQKNQSVSAPYEAASLEKPISLQNSGNKVSMGDLIHQTATIASNMEGNNGFKPPTPSAKPAKINKPIESNEINNLLPDVVNQITDAPSIQSNKPMHADDSNRVSNLAYLHPDLQIKEALANMKPMDLEKIEDQIAQEMILSTTTLAAEEPVTHTRFNLRPTYQSHIKPTAESASDVTTQTEPNSSIEINTPHYVKINSIKAEAYMTTDSSKPSETPASTMMTKIDDEDSMNDETTTSNEEPTEASEEEQNSPSTSQPSSSTEMMTSHETEQSYVKLGESTEKLEPESETTVSDSDFNTVTETSTVSSSVSPTKSTTPSKESAPNTLKPVHYYKHPSSATDQKLMQFNNQRPMVRPPALSNLKVTPVGQPPRIPVRLDPVPTQGLSLKSSTMGQDADVLAFSQLCNELAFNYWKSITAEKISPARSLVISPFALTSMLSMVFLGARGGTSGEMNEILKLDDMVTFNPHLVFKNITDSVEKIRDSHIMAAAFVREVYTDRSNGKVMQFFKEKVQQFYSGHVEEVNFNIVSDIIRRRTNLLVKRHSAGRVPEYLRTNSVWVNGPFATISANLLQTDCSRASVFDRDGEMFFQVHPAVRQRRLIPIPAVVWRSGFTAGYDAEVDATVVAFGNALDTLSTIYIMPGQQGFNVQADGLERLESRLIDTEIGTNAWGRLLSSLSERIGLEVQLPRFSHRSFINATAGLQRMGLKSIFNSDDADLRGLTGSASRDVYLSDMIQVNTFTTCGEGRVGDQHHVEMYPAPPLRRRTAGVGPSSQEFRSETKAEEHTPAAQDAGRAMYDDLLDPKYLGVPLQLRPRQARIPDAPRLRFDRPFLYFVRHNPTGMILFMGRFNPRLLP